MPLGYDVSATFMPLGYDSTPSCLSGTIPVQRVQRQCKVIEHLRPSLQPSGTLTFVSNLSVSLAHSEIENAMIELEFRNMSQDKGKFLPGLMMSVDGQPLEFLFDTGARQSSVARSLLQRSYSVLQNSKSIGASGNAHSCDLICIQELSLASLQLHDFVIQRADRNIFGLDILLSVPNGPITFTIDYSQALLMLEQPSLEETSKYPHTVRRLDTGHITIPGVVNACPVDLLFDTGADSTVVDQKFVDQHPAQFTYLRNEDGFDAHGNCIPSAVYVLNQLQIADLRLHDIEVCAFDYGDFLRGKRQGSPMTLGTNVIERATWHFDLYQNTWALS